MQMTGGFHKNKLSKLRRLREGLSAYLRRPLDGRRTARFRFVHLCTAWPTASHTTETFRKPPKLLFENPAQNDATSSPASQPHHRNFSKTRHKITVPGSPASREPLRRCLCHHRATAPPLRAARGMGAEYPTFADVSRARAPAGPAFASSRSRSHGDFPRLPRASSAHHSTELHFITAI
jgi:hypothetical protein